ncbi:hypothetical protein A2818_00780 [Candidatus Nomurabacteria bacterium RIFCSPHIGHO2_01_FULL_40_12]|uniref:Pilus assembly protein PilO n=1 Tax=Candidatus Nomurabacteria bacterium RIFCSPHIGHO2_01_FULL_40_12 TaxID=1801737 RepID=A0A1F6V1W3_9BACT|nr:MAG: hypothetical protein A2818_00780 [Candidatus Nomurabacteria bacterium RIFCSPHIGHO2_01_FULL_40_12]
MPAIFIGISLATFFAFTNPIYNDIFKLQAQVVSYNEALGNSKMLENERDKLTSKYNSIDPNNLMKLAKFLPGNIDNIRLILEIEQIASPFGMVLKDVKYNTTIDKNAASGTLGSPQGVVVQSLRKDYGVWDLEFSTVSTYNNFINFTKDLEKNLRIVDISSIEFSSNAGSNPNISAPDVYKYIFKIKTYWLKN